MRKAGSSVALWVVVAISSLQAAVAGVLMVLHKGPVPILIALLGMGISLGPCLGAYALIAAPHKQAARRLVLLTGGATILSFSLLSSANLDLEGAFMLLFDGAMGIAIGHTLVTCVVGPLFFGRALCGWGCWRAMVLELLPIRNGHKRREGRWRSLTWAGLGTAVAAAAVEYFFFGHRAGGEIGSVSTAGTKALLIGFCVYYALSIGLAFGLRDPRAFCKFLCPNAAILRLTSRFSMLKVRAGQNLCNSCGACSRACPMDVDVRAFARVGSRIRSGDCILCLRCVEMCPSGALKIGFHI